jgi:hypothetical protein
MAHRALDPHPERDDALMARILSDRDQHKRIAGKLLDLRHAAALPVVLGELRPARSIRSYSEHPRGAASMM